MNLPLVVALIAGGVPLVAGLIWRGIHGQFGADHLAGISIVASVLLGEYLAGAIVVLMLSGGNTLERFAVAEATSVLRALAKRVPTLAHRRRGDASLAVRATRLAADSRYAQIMHVMQDAEQ